MPDHDGMVLAAQVIAAYQSARRQVVTAESCTGGLIAGILTEIVGASAVFERGYVTYSNGAKRETLGVPQELLDRVGAVSAEVATAMAVGALTRSSAHVAIAVTGIAGPGGGSAEKPVGLVYLAVARRPGAADFREHDVRVERQVFTGDRVAIRNATVCRALNLLLSALDDTIRSRTAP